MFSLPHKHCKHCSVGRSRDSQTKSLILKIRVYRCKFAGKQGLLTTSHVYWPSEAVARPTILDTLFIASNSDNCEAIWKAMSENSSIVYKDQWTKRMLRNSICAEEKTSIILISTKLPAHSNAGLCQF